MALSPFPSKRQHIVVLTLSLTRNQSVCLLVFLQLQEGNPCPRPIWLAKEDWDAESWPILLPLLVICTAGRGGEGKGKAMAQQSLHYYLWHV